MSPFSKAAGLIRQQAQKARTRRLLGDATNLEDIAHLLESGYSLSIYQAARKIIDLDTDVREEIPDPVWDLALAILHLEELPVR